MDSNNSPSVFSTRRYASLTCSADDPKKLRILSARRSSALSPALCVTICVSIDSRWRSRLRTLILYTLAWPGWLSINAFCWAIWSRVNSNVDSSWRIVSRIGRAAALAKRERPPSIAALSNHVRTLPSPTAWNTASREAVSVSVDPTPIAACARVPRSIASDIRISELAAPLWKSNWRSPSVLRASLSS